MSITLHICDSCSDADAVRKVMAILADNYVGDSDDGDDDNAYGFH